MAWPIDLDIETAMTNASKCIDGTKAHMTSLAPPRNLSHVIASMCQWQTKHYAEYNTAYADPTRQVRDPLAPPPPLSRQTSTSSSSTQSVDITRAVDEVVTRVAPVDIIWYAIACMRCINAEDRPHIIGAYEAIRSAGCKTSLPCTRDAITTTLRDISVRWNHGGVAQAWSLEMLQQLEWRAIALMGSASKSDVPQFGLLALCARVFWNVTLHCRMAALCPTLELDVKHVVQKYEAPFTAWVREQLQYDPGPVFSQKYRYWFYQRDLPLGARVQCVRLEPMLLNPRLDVVWRKTLEDLNVGDTDIDAREKQISEWAEANTVAVINNPAHPAHDTLCCAMFVYMFTQSFRGADFAATYMITSDRLHERMHLIEQPVARQMKQRPGREPRAIAYRRPVIVMSGGEVWLFLRGSCLKVPSLKAACIAWAVLVWTQFGGCLEDTRSIAPIAPYLADVATAVVVE